MWLHTFLFGIDREINRKFGGGSQLKVPSVDKLQEAYAKESLSYQFLFNNNNKSSTLFGFEHGP